jgi:hypothetical protein
MFPPGEVRASTLHSAFDSCRQDSVVQIGAMMKTTCIGLLARNGAELLRVGTTSLHTINKWVGKYRAPKKGSCGSFGCRSKELLSKGKIRACRNGKDDAMIAN